jgi:hypothetical protein
LASSPSCGQVADSLASCTAEKGENERNHAEKFAIGPDRFRITFNAAARSSIAKEWRWLSAVMSVDYGQVIR